MSEDQGKMLLLSTFILVVAIVTWSEIKDNKTFPRPQRYVGAGVVWGVLGLSAPILTYPLAGMIGAATMLALLYTIIRPSSVAKLPTVIKQLSPVREV
jgi:hypothetical protein